ncbi:MAG: hypothetical protein GTN99_00220 [Candidatus Dadabacteria bacterium]|nr:hypothetical protein [Candidatus Dadabacteria bacterium]
MNITALRENTNGYIDKRQATYVKFTEAETKKSIKINFIDKRELFIKPGSFTGFSIVDKHPLLEQHENTNTTLYISTSTTEHQTVDSEISVALYEHYKGWRGIKNYCNIGYGVEKILKQGSGLLYEGPPSGAEVVKNVLKKYDISFTSSTEGKPNGKKYKVLFLGNNYVIAKDFKVIV